MSAPTVTSAAEHPRSPVPHQRFTLSRLQREWDRLVADRRSAEQVAAWQLPGVAPGALLTDVLAAAGMRTRPSATAASGDHGECADVVHDGERVPGDRVLAALVVKARTDPLAARIVLQRLLPGLSALARRRSRCVDEHLRNTDEAVAAAWTVIRTHRVERRPDWVASTLLRAVEYEAFVRAHRRRLVHELVEPSTMDVAVEADDVAGDPLTTIVSALRAAGASGLDAADGRLIGALLQCDQLSEVARQMEVSVRTVRNHRAAMIHRLRGVLAA